MEDEEDNEQSLLKCISDVGMKRKFPGYTPARDKGVKAGYYSAEAQETHTGSHWDVR